jgi:phytoene desaturase
MNYADFGMGTWHPKTGMFDVVSYGKLSQRTGVTFIPTNIEKIIVKIKQQRQ